VSGGLLIRNHQRDRAIDTRLLRKLLAPFLAAQLADTSVVIHLVGARRMAELNEQWLEHKGATDVITFNYGVGHGEIVVCVSEAEIQAAQFRSTWQQEVVRYMIHGILHLAGHDDQTLPARKKMKAVENRLVKKFSKQVGWRKAFRAKL
jgi:probable rRNA maturation factor